MGELAIWDLKDGDKFLQKLFCNYPGDCHFDEWSEEKSALRERFLPLVEMTPEQLRKFNAKLQRGEGAKGEGE